MRKLFTLALAVLATAAFTAPVVADDHGGDKFNVSVDTRIRGESSANASDLDDEDSGDSLGFGAYRAQVRFDAMLANNVNGILELQAFGIHGENATPERSFAGPLNGAGRLEDADDNADETIQAEFEVYQIVIQLLEIGGSNTNLNLGRQEYQIGNELILGNLDWYNGTVYDGALAWWDLDKVDIEAFYFVKDEQDIVQDDDEIDAEGGDDDITLLGANAQIDIMDGNQSITPYALYYRDGAGAGFNSGRTDAYTYGVHYGRSQAAAQAEGQLLDWSIEGAIQTGDIDPNGNNEISLGGMIIEGWLGFNFGEEGDTRHRVQIGMLQASGDDDDSDSDFDGFIQIAPDAHANNRLGDLDLFGGGCDRQDSPNAVQLAVSAGGFGASRCGMSNITNINVRYNYMSASGKNNFYAAFHQFTLTEDDNGSTSYSDDDVGTEFDFVYEHVYSDNLNFEFGAAMFQSGDFLTEFYGGSDADDITRFWASANLSWSKN